MKDSCRMHTKTDGSWWEFDANNIPLARVCDECIDEKLAKFRPDVQTNRNLDPDERIEPLD